MSTVVLIQVTPRYASGATVDLRLAGGGSRAYTQFGFGDWRGGVANAPRFSTAIGFDQGGLTGGALPQTAGLRFYPSDKALLSAIGNLVWDGARIIVTTGDDEVANPTYTVQLVGTVAAIKTDGGSVTFTIADLSVDLDKPVCPDTFAGTGDLEGGDDATGRIKRRTWGKVFNVEGKLLDKANNVYEFGDPNRGLQSFDMVKDKGASGNTTVVAWQGSALATLNALRSATPPSGGAAVAPSISCVKWWTKPAGPLTADFDAGTSGGYAGTPPGVAASIVSTYSTAIAIGNLATANGWQPGAAGVHCDNASETVANLLDRLLLPVSIAWVLDGAGTLGFRRLTWSSPVETLLADTITRDETFKPLKTRRLGFQRNYRQHSDSEISATLLLASDATYVDGTPIEALKPQEAGANATEKRTAAAITGQGSFATLNSAGYGSAYLTGFGQLSPLNNIYYGSPYLLESNGGTSATLNAFKTILGIASSITGQGAFATISSAGYGSSFLTGFGALAPLASIAFGSQYLLEASGGASASLNAFKTALGVASAISGQGSLATLSSLANGSSYLTGFGALSSLANIGFGSGYILEQAGGASATLNNFKTALGISSGITGQSPWATSLIPTTRLTDDSANVVYDGGLTLKAARWSISSAWQWSLGGAGDGPFLQTGSSTGASATVNLSDFVSWAAGSAGFLQAELFAGNVTAGYMACDLEFWDATSIKGYSPILQPPNGSGWNQYGVAFSAPAGTTRFRVRIYLGANTTNTNAAARRIKVSQVTYQTKFSDEATTGSLYDDGTYMNALKPGELGSNKTETRTAAGITGQGAFATLSSAAYGSALLTGFGALAAQPSVLFGGPYLLESSGVSATNANYKTSLGTAGGIAGQGAFATKDTAAYGSALLTGFGALSPLSAVTFGSANLLESAGTSATNANYKTALGTAGGITGQGAFATLSQASLTNTSLFQATGRFAPLDNGDGNYFNATTVQYGNSTVGYTSVQALKPGEVGANVTESRTAAAITGQTSWATFGVPTSAIYAPNSNIFKYPRPLPNLPASNYGWGTFTSASNLAFGAIGVGDYAGFGGPAYYVTRSNGPAGSIEAFVDVPVATDGTTYTASLTMRCAGGTRYARVGLLNAAKNAEWGVVTAVDMASYDNGTTRVKVTVTNTQDPNGGTGYAPFIRFHIGGTFPAASNAYQDVYWFDVKLESGAQATPIGQSSVPVVDGGNMLYSTGATANSLRPGELGANVTEGRTAAGITGQSQLATAPFGLTPGGGIAAGNVDNYGIGRLSSFWPGEAGANKTETRTAAAITGQGAFATTTVPVSRLTDDSANRVYDGALTLRGARWYGDAAWGWSAGGAGDGPFFQTGQSAGAGPLVYYSDFIPWAAGSSGFYQAELFAGGVTAGAMGSDVEFWSDTAGLGKTGASLSPTNGAGWTQYGGAFTAPAGTTKLRVRLFLNANTTNTNSAARRFKVSQASAYTRFSDEATTGASYDDGTYMNNLKPQEVGSNKTEGRTAAGISGQGAFATLSQASLTNTSLFQATGRFAALDNGDGNYYNATAIQYGSTALGYYQSVQSLKPQEVGSNVTEGRTAAAIAGQGAFATTSVPVSRLTDDSANYVYDGALTLRAARWGINPAWTWTQGGGGDGPYIATGSGTTSTPTLNFSDFIPWAAGVSGYLQAEIFTGGLSAGSCNCDVEFFNASGSLGTYGGQLNPVNGRGWTQYGAPFVTPAGTTRIRVRMYMNTNSTNNNTAARRFKVSQASAITKFSDEATTGAAYDDGTYMNNLRPAEVGSNVTEARTAAAIAGQGRFATTSTVSQASLFQYFTLNAFSLNYSITRSDGQTTVTESMAITSLGIASGIAGQGSFATKSQAGAGDIAPSAVQLVTYQVLQNAVNCPVGN